MAEKLKLEIDQGSRFDPVLVYRDGDGLGVDLTNAEIRMQIRTPDRDQIDPPALSLVSGSNTAAGSTITIDEAAIAATVITDFGSGGVVTATGAAFKSTSVKVTEFDANSDPLTVEAVELRNIQLADLATISGSTSNDGATYRVFGIPGEDSVELYPQPTVEAAAGTIQIDAKGTFQIVITAAETDAFTWDRAEYDLEIVENTIGPTPPKRIFQGTIVLNKQTTK